MRTRIAFGLVSAFMLGSQAHAANVAFDNTSAWAYNDGWQTGDNGGYGWGAWTLTTSNGNVNNNGHFILSSVLNADLSDNATVGGVANDSDINTTIGPLPDQSGAPDPNTTVAQSWGMYANNGQLAQGFRPFTGGALAVGQVFSMDFDNGYIDNGGQVGLGLLNAAGATLWQINYSGGSPFYFNVDAAGTVATTVGYGDEGLNVAFTLTGPASYTMTLTRRDGVSQTINGNLIANGDQSIAQVRAFNSNAGDGSPRDAFFNTMTVVPETSAALIGAIGLLGLLRRRR